VKVEAFLEAINLTAKSSASFSVSSLPVTAVAAAVAAVVAAAAEAESPPLSADCSAWSAVLSAGVSVSLGGGGFVLHYKLKLQLVVWEFGFWRELWVCAFIEVWCTVGGGDHY